MDKLQKPKPLGALLSGCLEKHFGVNDPAFNAFILSHAEFIDVAAEERLLRQGDPSDDVYFLLTGRLRARQNGPDGEITLGDIGRGETVGELALFTGRPRMANVYAVRDSLVAKISKATLEKAVQKHPGLILTITGKVIERYEQQIKREKPPSTAVILTLLPLSDNIDAKKLAEKLAAQRRSWGQSVELLCAEDIRRDHGPLSKPDTVRPRGPVSLSIAELEKNIDCVLLIADPDDPAWTRTAAHHADEILLLADAKEAPQTRPIETIAMPEDHNISARQSLILIHPKDCRAPKDTAKWLGPRPGARHFHMRRDNADDLSRLGRILAGRGVGLVLSGGGARGFSHLGIAKALHETGVKIDMIGGTSMGAILGTFMAIGLRGEALVDHMRSGFVDAPRGNITGDYNLIPLISLVKGQRTRAVTEERLRAAIGTLPDIEDCWHPFFMIVSNYTRSCEDVVTHGPVVKTLLASSAIPGILPPQLHKGEIWLDGGSFNNFPVDVMRRQGAGKIIGIDLMKDTPRPYYLDEMPRARDIFWDRLRPRKRRRYKFPGIASTLLKATVITSMSRQKDMAEQTDWLFNPDVGGVGMVEWKAFDKLVASAYDAARAQIAQMDETELAPFRGD